MNVYTAERSDGTIVLVHAEPGYNQGEFEHACLRWVEDQDGDSVPHQLELYEWESEAVAGSWLTGVVAFSEESWTTMARKALYATLTWTYAGDGDGKWVVTSPGQDPHAEGRTIAQAEMRAAGVYDYEGEDGA